MHSIKFSGAKQVLLALSAFLTASSLSVIVGGNQASADQVPFKDPYAVGGITLCNRQLQPITSGSLVTIPFVWRAVSSTPAPAGYTLAELYLAQPIQHINPAGWDQREMTFASRFTNRSRPMTQATYHDLPLLEPDVVAPPYWDGYYELRMEYTAPQQSPYQSPYPTAVIRVTGTSWTQVTGGGGSCTDGTAVSVETSYLPSSQTEVPRTLPASVLDTLPGYNGASVGHSRPPDGSPISSTQGSGPGHGSASGPGRSLAATGTSRSSHQSSGGWNGWLTSLVAVVAAAAVTGALFLGRRRLRTTRRASAASNGTSG